MNILSFGLLALALAIPLDDSALKDVVAKVKAEAAGKARSAAAEKALEEHAKDLESGDGLHYRGILQQASGKYDEAYDSFVKHADGAPDSALGQSSLVQAMMLANATGKSTADRMALCKRVKADLLPEDAKPLFESLKKSIDVEMIREGLTGQPLPKIEVKDVVGADAFDFAAMRGKVLVIDFFATWCPPCREVIPEMVKLQEEHGKDGLQVVSVTKYYGYGMDFSGDSPKLPHGGKAVGSRKEDQKIPAADELRVNQVFHKAFSMNYPIVFSADMTARDLFGVTGIPTVFVVGRDGKIVGSVVGGGEESHAQLMEFVKTALAVNKS